MSATGGGGRESGRELARVVNFSDGVFAIVITLLILTIQVPEVSRASVARELPGRLLALEPKVFSYVVSFLVVAVYWMAHHRVFKPIRGYDAPLLWLNFVFLMTISFLPFPTSLLGEYGEQQLSVVIYAVNVAAASLLLSTISWYAKNKGHLTDPDLGEEDTTRGRVQALAVPAVFLSSIAVSFFSVTAATYSWLLLLVVGPLLRRIRPR